MVVAHHYFGFAEGYSGVTFFYVLSGFILTVNYGQISTWEERRDFWWKRFARIYPTHVATLLFTLPVATGTLTMFIAQALLVQSWVPSWSYWFAFNAPSWSISNEAFFYACFPWLLIWLRDSSSWRIFPVGCGVVGLALAWTFFLPSQTFDSGATRFLFYFSPPLRTFEFMLGMTVALHAPRRRFSFRHEIGIVLLFGIFAVLPAPPALRASLSFVPLAVAIVYVFSQSDGPLARLLCHRALVLLGDASFALYMLHYPLMLYLGKGVPQALLAIGLSVLLFICFERPMQKWLRAFGPHLPTTRSRTTAW
jgi:peptidoglycan/LPS O-acetylase OafA/YrhL